MRCDLQIFSGCVCHLEQLHAQSPFLFRIVFGIIISFLTRVMSVSKSFFFVSRAYERFGAKRSSSGAFGFDDVLEVFLTTPLNHQAFFANFDYDWDLQLPSRTTTTTGTWLRPRLCFFQSRAGVTCLTAIVVAIGTRLFPKQSRCYLPDSNGDPRAGQSSLVMIRRKLE